MENCEQQGLLAHIFFFFFFNLIYLAAPGLSCGTWDLRCGMQDLLVVACELLAAACGI